MTLEHRSTKNFKLWDEIKRIWNILLIRKQSYQREVLNKQPGLTTREKSPLVIFTNDDVFRDKVQHTPLNICFPDFESKAILYILKILRRYIFREGI